MQRELEQFMPQLMKAHFHALMEMRSGATVKGNGSVLAVSRHRPEEEPNRQLTIQYEMDLLSTGGVDAEIERTLERAWDKRALRKGSFKEDLLYLRPRDS